MAKKKPDFSISKWVRTQITLGKYSFTYANLKQENSTTSTIAIKSALSRLVISGQIVSIHKGYFLIIPPQYHYLSMLPPALYIDGLMNYLQRPYYLGLLSAAAFQGATHQQPQEFYAFTDFPALRPTNKKGIKVNYISKKEIPIELLESKKTEAGYVKISSPILTAIDLVQYAKRVGGYSRVASVLNELAESITTESINNKLINITTVYTLQRLGYLLEFLDYKTLSDKLYHLIKENKIYLYRTVLNPSLSKSAVLFNSKWNLVINTSIEIDE